MLQNSIFTEEVVATKYYLIQWDSECAYMYFSELINIVFNPVTYFCNTIYLMFYAIML